MRATDIRENGKVPTELPAEQTSGLHIGGLQAFGLGILCAFLGFFVSLFGLIFTWSLFAIGGAMIAGGTLMGFRWSTP